MALSDAEEQTLRLRETPVPNLYLAAGIMCARARSPRQEPYEASIDRLHEYNERDATSESEWS